VITSDELDVWRANYRAGTASIADHRELYDRIAAEYPDQGYCSLDLMSKFLEKYQRVTSVVELGGWDGAVAGQMLRNFDLECWVNYEIAQVDQVCQDERYRCIVPENDWSWNIFGAFHADAFVASHSLEHLTLDHLRDLMRAIQCEYAYVDVPLSEEGEDWTYSTTTHALELSIGEFDSLWEGAGWTIDERIYRGEVTTQVQVMRAITGDASLTGIQSHVRYLSR